MLMCRRFAASLAVLALGVCQGAFATPTFHLTDNTFSSEDSEIRVVAEEDGGDIRLTLDVISTNTGNTGDLRGLWFDVVNEALLADLTVTGADVTSSLFDANNVQDFPRGGPVIGPLGPFDAGIALGTAGAGNDDIQHTVFTLAHPALSLNPDTFFRSAAGAGDRTMAARVTSVGAPGSSRDGSSKTAGSEDESDPGTGSQGTGMPEPLTGGLALLSVGAVMLSTRRRRF